MCKTLQTLDVVDRTLILFKESQCRRLMEALEKHQTETVAKCEAIKAELWTHLSDKYPDAVKDNPCLSYEANESDGYIFIPCHTRLMSESLQAIFVVTDGDIADPEETESDKNAH